MPKNFVSFTVVKNYLMSRWSTCSQQLSVATDSDFVRKKHLPFCNRSSSCTLSVVITRMIHCTTFHRLALFTFHIFLYVFIICIYFYSYIWQWTLLKTIHRTGCLPAVTNFRDVIVLHIRSPRQ